MKPTWFGFCIGPPKVLGFAEPALSIRTDSTFGVPFNLPVYGELSPEGCIA